MAILKCKMCGGDLNLIEGASTAECEYCGSVQTVPKVDDEKKLTLFARANRLRAACEFDKAAGIYEAIVTVFPVVADAYWGLVLCKYGIEYVDDPATGKKIPTCHRSSFDSIMEDNDFEQTLENADPAARKVYRDEAKAIEEIRKGIIAVSNNEQPYDIFICYKETAEDGQRTLDSVLAQDVYDALTDKGYRVFFSRITLEDKLGMEYEPYIFAALNSAKIMLAFGTDYEYFNAVWVKNEWSRYLKLMAKDKAKHLIPCYKGIDAYDMPKEFAKLQAQDLGKVGATQDLLRGIEKILPRQAESVKETVVVQATSVGQGIAPLLKRAFMFLEDGDWNSANEYCDKVLDQEPECAEAYLGKLMAELHVKKQEDLQNQAKPFDNRNSYQKIIRYADDKLKDALTGYISFINTRNENARLDGIYTRAKNEMSAANTESAYKEAAHLFESISEYRDSAVLVQSCYEKAEIARKDAILSEGKSKMSGEVISNYESAIKLFESISGWKDADEKIYTCQKKIEEIKAKEEAERLEKERKAEIERKEAEHITKRNKKMAIIAISILCAFMAFVIILTTVIIPAQKRSDFIATYGQEIYDMFGVVEEGAYINFGAYEQDNTTSNGKEDIEWLVLEVKDGKALVISKYALDRKEYNASCADVTWETCTLRKWLNNDFINAAFSAEEKAMIPTVTVSADKNPDYSTNPGNATQDQVFLLSITQVNRYLGDTRKCIPTAYAVAEGSENSCSSWWLRSPGEDQNNATYCYHIIQSEGMTVHNRCDIRPALWIDLSKLQTAE